LAKSSPVNIFTTPGTLEAFDMSTFDIVALACGERTKYAYVWLARLISDVYLPLPVRNFLSSFLSTHDPIKLLAILFSLSLFYLHF